MNFQIDFGVHVPEDSVTSMVTGLNSYGLVSRNGKSHRYLVDVQRPAKAAALEIQLKSWEKYGFLTWQARQQTEG